VGAGVGAGDGAGGAGGGETGGAGPGEPDLCLPTVKTRMSTSAITPTTPLAAAHKGQRRLWTVWPPIRDLELCDTKGL
jgi:hypothetical protein